MLVLFSSSVFRTFCRRDATREFLSSFVFRPERETKIRSSMRNVYLCDVRSNLFRIRRIIFARFLDVITKKEIQGGHLNLKTNVEQQNIVLVHGRATFERDFCLIGKTSRRDDVRCFRIVPNVLAIQTDDDVLGTEEDIRSDRQNEKKTVVNRPEPFSQLSDCFL